MGADPEPATGASRPAQTPPGESGSFGTFVALAAGIGYALFFYRDLLFDGQVFVFRDLYSILLTFEHTARVLARWSWPPLWDPFCVTGRPFAADLMTGVYYPLNWLLRLLPVSLGFGVSIALHHFIAAAGLFTLLRCRAVSLLPALLGGLVFGFGGLMVSLDTMFNGLQSAAWVPWILVAFERWCERRTPADVAVMALALALATLGAMPEFVVLANVLVVALAVDRARAGSGPALGRSLAALAVADLVALGLCSVVMAPFLEYLANSSRFEGLQTSGVTAYSLRPLGVLTFLLPRHYSNAAGQFHETAALWEGSFTTAPWALTLYVGTTVVLLLPIMSRLSSFRRWWWAAIGLLFLALALGRNLPGYVWALEHFATLRMFRYPEKFLLVVHALLAVGVAAGLENALRNPGGFRGVSGFAAGLAIAALLAHGLTVRAGTWEVQVLSADLLLLAVSCVAVAVLAVLGRARPRWAGLLLLLLAAADLYRVNGRLLPTMSWEALQRVPPAVAVMQRGDDPLRIYSDGLGRAAVPAFPDSVVQEQNLLLMHVASYYLIGNLNAPASTTLADHEALEELIESLPHERLSTVFGALNVAYVTSPKRLEFAGLRLVQEAADALGANVYEVGPRSPRAFVARRLRSVRSRKEAIEHLRAGSDPSVEVAVDAESIPAGMPEVAEGTVEIASYLPERIALRARMRTPGLLVLADTYYPGWQAVVDGVPAPVERANYFVRGVFVGAGEHRVVFRYAPSSWRLGAAGSGLTCVAVLLGLLWGRRSKRFGRGAGE